MDLLLFLAAAIVPLVLLCAAYMDDVEYWAGLAGDTPEVQRLVRLARLDAEVRARLMRMLEERGIDVSSPDEFLPWPREDQLRVPGGIELGHIHQTKASLLISKEEATRGVLLTGQAGSGKTNLLCWLCARLKSFGTIWVVDTGRRDLAGLAKYLDIRYIAKQHCCINPLEAPGGCSLERWFQDLSALFAYSFGLGLASEMFMYTMLRRTHEAVGKSGRFPSLLDLESAYSTYRPRGLDETGYVQRTLHKLRPLILACPEYAMYERGFDLGYLLRTNTSVIWEASEQEEFRSFIFLFFAYWIYEYRLHDRA